MESIINATNYKSNLSRYSNLVTSGMRSNKYLESKVLNKQQILSQLKALLIKYASLDSSKKDLCSELGQDLIFCNESFKQKNLKLQSDIQNLELKVIIINTLILLIEPASRRKY